MFEIDNIDKKVVQNKYSPLNIKAIDNLKESISQIDPKKIISSALISANKRSLDNKKKIETIEQAKNNIVNSFLSEIDKTDKNIDQLRLLSKEKFNDFKNSTNLIVERTQKEAKEYISKLNLITKENKMLKKKYYDLKNQFDDILAKQKNSLKEIENMKNSENILISNKPVFNDFLKQFKAQAPKKIIEDIEKQKDGYKMLKSEYDSTINKIIFGKKIFDLKVEKEEKKISNMNYKIHELEEENSLKQENFGNLVEDLKKEIKKLQGLKEENDKYRKMLYQLYNRLIENFSLDKDINLQKKLLKLKKEDYKPNLLDDNEIFKYIKLMISSMNRSTSDQLLRETIAYSNMITRVYLKNKINLKYEPYSTFKELKDIMEKNEEKIEKLRNNVREYEEKLKIMTAENKKLNKIINYFHMEKNRNIEIKQNTLNINYRNSLKFKKLYNKERFSKQYNSSKYRNSSLGYQNKRYRLNSANPQIKRSLLKRANIVDDSDSSKTQKTSVNNIKEIKKSNSIYDLNNKKIQENIDFKLLRNPLYQSIQSMNNKVINKYYQIDNKINKENKKVKDNYKKAKDQNIFTYLNEFQQLINHTNRLFLYQAKISHKFYLERNRNLSLNKPKFNKIFKKKRMNKSSDDLLQDFVSSKIISKINGIIKNLQYKDEDNNKNNMEIN
jgi:hypothetical protein